MRRLTELSMIIFSIGSGWKAQESVTGGGL